jgi:Bacterial low temperature requirement A protein (LtrA)
MFNVYARPAMRDTAEQIDQLHMCGEAGGMRDLERRFFIIALGETVLTMGNAFADEPFELERLFALAIGFTGAVALWWCYFQAPRGSGGRGGRERRGRRRRWVVWHVDADADRARADRDRRRRRARDRPSRRRRDAGLHRPGVLVAAAIADTVREGDQGVEQVRLAARDEQAAVADRQARRLRFRLEERPALGRVACRSCLIPGGWQ